VLPIANRTSVKHAAYVIVIPNGMSVQYCSLFKNVLNSWHIVRFYNINCSAKMAGADSLAVGTSRTEIPKRGG
jgi:hypothetical protein